MAGTAILERELQTREEKPAAVSAAEAEHSRRISQNYDVFRYSTPTAWANAEVREERVAEREEKPSAPAASYTAERVSSYTPVAAPSGRRVLFEDVEYKNGELIGNVPAPSASAAAPAIAPAVAPAPVEVPQSAQEEDALPTKRTMETLRRETGEEAVAESKTTFLSALSTKTKLVLLSIVCAVVLAIVLICVNTGIINSLDGDLSGLRARVEEQQQTYQALGEEIEEATDPYSQRVVDYAESHGMVRGD